MRIKFILNQCLYSAFSFIVLMIGAKTLSNTEYATYGFIYSFYLIFFSIPFSLLYLPMLSNIISNKQGKHVLFLVSFISIVVSILFGCFYVKFELLGAISIGGMISALFAHDYNRRLLMSSNKIGVLNIYEVGRLIIFLFLMFFFIISGFKITVINFIIIITISNIAFSLNVVKYFLKSTYKACEWSNIKSSIRDSFFFGKWLLINNLVQAISGNVFIFVIATISTADTVASVTVYRSILGVFTVLILAVDNYLSPRLASLIKAKRNMDAVKLINNEILTFTPLFLIGVLLVSFFGKEIIVLFYGSSYIKDFDFLIILLISSIGMFLQRFPLIFIRTYNDNKSIFKFGLITSILNIVLIYPVGYIWNVSGVLILLVFSNFLYFIFLWKRMRFIYIENYK